MRAPTPSRAGIAVRLDTGAAGWQEIEIGGVIYPDDYIRLVGYLGRMRWCAVVIVEATPRTLRLRLELAVGMKSSAPEIGAGGPLRPAYEPDDARRPCRPCHASSCNDSAWLPHAITIARMVVAFPLLWLLATGHTCWPLGGSDCRFVGRGGWLARQAFNCRSVLGGLLDPLADKLLLRSASSACVGAGAAHLGGGVVIVGRGHPGCAFIWWRVMGTLNPKPTFISKMTTVLQLLLAATLLARLAGHDIIPDLIPPLVLATTAMTVASGAHYVVRYSLRAWLKHRSGT